MRIYKSFTLIKTFLLILCLFVNNDLFSQANNGNKIQTSNSPVGGLLKGGFTHPIVVSFATEGLWAQRTIISKINTDTGTLIGSQGLGLWVPLLYLISLASALVMMAMGQPPKMYLWFALGPGIYYWLINSTANNDQLYKGFSWTAGEQYVQNMKPVWKLAEVGMTNSALIYNMGNIVGPPGPGQISGFNKETGPQSPGTKVNWLFNEYDELLSATIQELVEWTGIYNQKSSTNLKSPRVSDSRGVEWYLMTNYKWKILNDITSASVRDGNVRDSLVYFMSSRCGDVISRKIDKAAYIEATNTKGINVPPSVFKGSYDSVLGYSGTTSAPAVQTPGLASQSVPKPISISNLLKEPEGGQVASKAASFNDFLKSSQGSVGNHQPDLSKIQDANDISCSTYLWILMQAFRWEASNAYIHLTKINQEYSVNQDDVVYSLLYGWTFPDNVPKLTAQDQKDFVSYMIMAHMFRNEMTMARKPTDDMHSSSSEDLLKGADTQIRNLGGKGKWTDIFTAFKIFPHIQGLIAYFLILAFPIALMLIVVPGWWKSLFTWMGFYAYIKSWDFGFALAASVERSVWARIGNSDKSEFLNGRILELAKGFLQLSSNNGSITNIQIPAVETNLPFAFSSLGAGQQGPFAPGAAVVSVLSKANYRTDEALFHFDKLLTLSNVLDYDLNNSYYIYIMAAVYMAVPTIAAQLFLKGKAAMVSGLMDAAKGLGQEGSKAGVGVAQSKMLTDADNSFQVAGQTDYAKAMMDKDSFARKAMESQNLASQIGLEKQKLGISQQFVGNRGKLEQMGSNFAKMHTDAMGAVWSTRNQMISEEVDKFGKFALRNINGWVDNLSGGRTAANIVGSRNKTGKFTYAGGAGGAGGVSGTAGGGFPSGFDIDDGSPGYDNNLLSLVKEASLGGRLEGSKQSLLRGNAGTAAGYLLGMKHSRESTMTEAATLIGQSKATLSSFHLGAQEDSAKVMASRFRAAAEQQANESKWQSQRNLGNQYNKHFAALGATPGRYSAGPKPTNFEGMAALGQLEGGTINPDGSIAENGKTGGFQKMFNDLDYQNPNSVFHSNVMSHGQELNFMLTGNTKSEDFGDAGNAEQWKNEFWATNQFTGQSQFDKWQQGGIERSFDSSANEAFHTPIISRENNIINKDINSAQNIGHTLQVASTAASAEIEQLTDAAGLGAEKFLINSSAKHRLTALDATQSVLSTMPYAASDNTVGAAYKVLDAAGSPVQTLKSGFSYTGELFNNSVFQPGANLFERGNSNNYPKSEPNQNANNDSNPPIQNSNEEDEE